MSDPIPLPTTLPDDDGPLVTVFVATYDCDYEHIERAFRSVAEQTYTNLELLVVDSSDDGRLRATAEATDWIRYAYQEPRGVSPASNKAIELASGEFLSLLDDDDYYAPHKIERQLEVLDSDADVVYADVYDLDDETGTISYRSAMDLDEPDEHWIKFFRYDGILGSVPAATVMFRHECMTDERFDPDLDGGEDYHLWVRLFERYRPAYIDEPLAYMRQRDGSLSSDPDMMYSNRMDAIEKLCDRYPELEPYRSERERVEYHDYGRRLLAGSRTAEARSIFYDVLTDHRYPPAGVLLLVSLLPFGHARILDILDGIHDRLSSYSGE